MQHSEPKFLAVIGTNLPESPANLDFIPESANVGNVVDVMERDQPGRLDGAHTSRSHS